MCEQMKCKKMKIDEAKALTDKGWYIQEKLDGTRTFWNGKALISPERETRKNERFEHIVNELKDIDAILDGEIYLPNGTIHNVNSSDNWANCRFAIFDILELNGKNLRDLPYSKRKGFIKMLVKGKHYLEVIKEYDDLDTAWNEIIDNNKEGLVIKNPNSKYEDRRSENWIKVKHYKEITLEIVDFIQGSEKGAFILSNGGKMSALSKDKVEQYQTMIQNGEKVFAEIEYLTMTKNGKLFQPILKRLVTEKECSAIDEGVGKL